MLLHKIDIKLKDSYPIYIGKDIISDVKQYLIPHMPGNKVVIITDIHVGNYWLQLLESELRKCHKDVYVIISMAGEGAKSFANYQQIANEILLSGVDRSTTIVALGGGVIGDLSGFLASTLLRGLPFIQIPTSLLAQVDSSVGGKVGINSEVGKNTIGSFWQPKAVVIDVNTLMTLPKRHFINGMAEVIKYGLIKDYEFMLWLQENYQAILNKQCDALAYIVSKSCQNKADIVMEDEFENGKRALLNFGHSFAHVLEKATLYSDKLLHGEAVAIGSVFAAYFSKCFASISDDDMNRVIEIQHLFGLPCFVDDIDDFTINAEDFLYNLTFDKKNKNNQIRLILLKKLGEAYIEEHLSNEQIQSAIEQHLS